MWAKSRFLRFFNHTCSMPQHRKIIDLNITVMTFLFSIFYSTAGGGGSVIKYKNDHGTSPLLLADNS